MLSVLRQSNKICYLTRAFHKTSRMDGYIVLVPEIGEDAHATDGILKTDGLPAFNDITIEVCLGAIGHQAASVEKKVKQIENTIKDNQGKANTRNIFCELDEVTGPLDTTWGIAKALYLGNCTLIPTKSYMNIHERARTARASKFSNKTIYDALETHSQLSPQEIDLSTKSDENRLLEKYLLEGKLNGLALASQQKDELKEVLSHLGKERANFKNKVNMAIHTFNHVISDYNLVRDFPPTLLEAIAKDPNQSAQGPWKITLQPQIVEGFLKYCPDREQRWNLWQANVRKASGQLEKSLENSTHIEKIRALRKRQANILGYPTYTAMSMQTKMIGSDKKIKEIFAKILNFAGPAQSVELEKLQKFATGAGFQHKLDFYDIAYWQRKYLQSHYHINEETLREYFPLPKVITGLFSLSEKIFNIKIVERNNAQVWQPAVKYFDVYDCDNVGTTPIGGFYLDCYSKENKYGKNNGWMVSIRNLNISAGNKPLCALIFNFTPPVYGKPYLMNIDDLRIVFKTFGTAMQHLLTKASYSDLAGLSNIEWDASQVSGHVMSNFLDNKETLKDISSHYASEDPIPETLSSNLNLLKTSLAGYNLCQELYYADLDLELHQTTDFWLDVVKRLWAVYRCMPLDKKDAHPCSMTEIFSGDWAAAHFSHLYSSIIAADISDAFIENLDVQAVGKRFKSTFLASGGSVSTAEVFRRFRGRDPSVEALLKSLNILMPTQTSGDL